jgi:uncharacterized membrane protein
MADAVRRDVQRMGTYRHPIYGALFPVPVVCFAGALLTDLAYYASDGNLLWLAFSSWLLLAGLLAGAIAALILLIDVIRDPAMRAPFGWAHMLFFYAALLVELLNIFVHERDGWTAVVPIGMTLSIIGTVLILVAGWLRPRLVELAR